MLRAKVASYRGYFLIAVGVRIARRVLDGFVARLRDAQLRTAPFGIDQRQ
jgi:hypothetical protein